ncbi:hypothetical protein POTOM_061562 [Populus tomentosa]|uniref:Ankyrin repeat family protein n=1 Tax=Populus tomentosa TaxID=118781 RepID=A0A8X8BZM5_POPTO|nr:hypothetical protein POTOM_061562 [Populus tomentosa]
MKLTKTTDENDWSPLHYAAYYFRSIGVLKVLLEYDASAASIAETEKKRTTLHIAAIQGRVKAMKEIIVSDIYFYTLITEASKDIKVFEKCLKIPELARLKTKKDDNGNTPFHLIAALVHEKKLWGRVLYEGKLCGLNKRKLSVIDIYLGNFGEIQLQNSMTPYMDPVLFKAAAEGHIGPFENYQTRRDQLLTPDENTILHVYLGNQSREPESTYFVDKILEIQMLRITTEEQATALHEAARNRRSHVVEILTKEDRPELSYSANVHGETPLYIAASSWGQEQEKVIDEILANCISVLDYGGPNGRTALHAASAVGDHGRILCSSLEN